MRATNGEKNFWEQKGLLEALKSVLVGYVWSQSGDREEVLQVGRGKKVARDLGRRNERRERKEEGGETLERANRAQLRGIEK